jgi:hypothetical protein
MYHVSSMSLQPLISRALAGSPESIGLLLLSLTLRRLLLAFQDYRPLSHLIINTAFFRPISHPLAQPNSHVQTLRLAETRPHLHSDTYLSAPTLHIIAIPPPYTTLLFPRICHPEIAACDDPTSLWPTQSPPPPLVRPDDRRIVYFITAQQTINIIHEHHFFDNTTNYSPKCPSSATRFASRTKTPGRPRASSRRLPTMLLPHQSQLTWPKSRPPSTN